MTDLSAILDQMDQTEEQGDFSRLRLIIEPQILMSHDPVLLWRLGQIYRRRKLWADAEVVLKEAIKWGPSLPEPFRDLGLLYLYRDDIPPSTGVVSAREILERAVRIEKINSERSPITHTLLGKVFEWLDQPRDAEAQLRMALEIDPHYEEAQYNLAMVLDESRREERVRLLRQSIIEDPEYFIALRDLGFELVKCKQFTEAGIYLNRALSLDHEDVPLHWYLGQLRWMQDDIGSAEIHYKKAVELDPANATSYRLLGRFYGYQCRTEEANRELFSAIELEPESEDSISAYQKFLDNLEDRSNARRLFDVAQQHSALDQSFLAGLTNKLFS